MDEESEMKILGWVYTRYNIEEAPKLNGLVGGVQTIRPKEFTIGSMSKVWKNKEHGSNVASLQCWQSLLKRIQFFFNPELDNNLEPERKVEN